MDARSHTTRRFGMHAAVAPQPNGAAALSVSGELDITAVTRLRDLVFATLIRYGPRLTLDLSGVTFCDASGLRALDDCVAEAKSSGGALSLPAPEAYVGVEREPSAHEAAQGWSPAQSFPMGAHDSRSCFVLISRRPTKI
ncbi:STAS domain-containing protein [Nonomuraea sp. NPDC050556]|uniref:STAS domain-containing protein n=1 Tax=Nonomuraea sp. NPDC050556 TaxID=3364369 RepID=UPI0037BBCD44